MSRTQPATVAVALPRATVVSHHGVALLDQLVHVPPRQGALEEHHDVLDHVLVRDVLQERRQWLLRLRLEEVELHHLKNK